VKTDWIVRTLRRRNWHFEWSAETALYLGYRTAAYVVMNLGDDVALAALMFVN